MRQVLLAREEPHERPALTGNLISDCSPQHRIPCLQCIKNRALSHRPFDIELYLAHDLRQCPQMCREHDSNHLSVCTSTDSTGGRSRTMGVQVSPASADAYTCPPVVPKYTPHLSSESTAIESRST